MRNLLMLLLVPLWLLGCKQDTKVNGWDVRNFYPHQASSYRQTPQGHMRDAGPFASVQAGFCTEQDIDSAVDYQYSKFAFDFPDLPTPHAFVDITDDYVMYVIGAGWAAGMDMSMSPIYVCLWSRSYSNTDPGAEFIKRGPDQNYSQWRYTSFPLLPALEHELLHTIIGDPTHSSAYWSRIH